MKALIAIYGYGRGQSIFDMILPLWERHGIPILVFSPTDDPLKTTHEHIVNGLSQHTGMLMIHRKRHTLEVFSARKDVDVFILAEYDSFFLSKEIPLAPGFHSIVQENVEPSFASVQYPLFPYMMDAATVELLCEASQLHLDCFEKGHGDRWFGALAKIAGIRLRDYYPRGFVRNTINGQSDMMLLAKAIEEGAFAVHGVKNRFVLEFIIKHWNLLHPGTPEWIDFYRPKC